MDASSLSNQDLLRRCLDHDDQVAWQEFVRRFQPLIAGVIVKTVRRWRQPTAEEIDDLVGDTYVKLLSNDRRVLRRFEWRGENSLFGYLKTIASSVAQDWMRKMSNPTHGGEVEHVDIDDMPGGSASTRENAVRHVQIEEIWRCLESQTSDPNFSRNLTIFFLYFEQGMTAKAISRLPGIDLTVEGVETALLRMTRLVRDRLKRPDPPQPPGRAAAPGG